MFFTGNTDLFNVYIPKPNIEWYTKRSFQYAGGKMWNCVPNNIHNVPSVEAFRYAFLRNLIVNTGTLTVGSNIIYERSCIILMCMIYFL